MTHSDHVPAYSAHPSHSHRRCMYRQLNLDADGYTCLVEATMDMVLNFHDFALPVEKGRHHSRAFLGVVMVN